MQNSRTVFLLSALFSIIVSFTVGVVTYQAVSISKTPIRDLAFEKSGDMANSTTSTSPASLYDIESGVKAVAKSVSPSVVSIVISKDVPVYRTDPFGFFYEPSGTVRKQVG
jgi:hypothetical protein